MPDYEKYYIHTSMELSTRSSENIIMSCLVMFHKINKFITTTQKYRIMIMCIIYEWEFESILIKVKSLAKSKERVDFTIYIICWIDLFINQ